MNSHEKIVQIRKNLEARDAQKPKGCLQSITLAALVFCMACGGHQKAAKALDIARRLHWEACEAQALLAPSYCAQELERLKMLEPGIENDLSRMAQAKALITHILPWLDWLASAARVESKKPP